MTDDDEAASIDWNALWDRHGLLLIAAGATLAIVLVQLGMVAIGFAYCGEGRDSLGMRDSLCESAESGGYVALAVVPPLLMMAAGWLAKRRGDRRLLVGGVITALVVGVCLPYGLAAGSGF